MIRFHAGALPVATPVLLGTLLFTALPARAQENPDAHEHGAASLDIVLDGNQLLIELDSPADNVLGFESEPTTDADRATLEQARDTLGDGALLVPDAAGECSLVDVDVEMPFEAEGRDDESHGDEDDEHGDAHGDAHGDEHHGDEEHADVRASYVFTCDSPERLSSIGMTLFERFAGFERIDVQLVGPGGQTSVALSGSGQPISLDAIR